MIQHLQSLLPRIDESESHLRLSGLPEAFQAFLLASFIRLHDYQLLIIVPQLSRAQTLLKDVSLFLDLWPLLELDRPEKKSLENKIFLFPPWTISPYEPFSPDNEVVGERLECLERLRKKQRVSVITTIDAVIQRVLPRDELAGSVMEIIVGQELSLGKVIDQLIRSNYRESELVEEKGTFARRGGLIDIFPPNLTFPIRIEFFGDQVDSIRQFDPDSQLSFDTLSETEIIPFREVFFFAEKIPEISSKIESESLKLGYPSKKAQLIKEDMENFGHFPGQEWLAPFMYNKMETLFDYLPSDIWICLDDQELLSQCRKQNHDLIKAAYQKALKQEQIVPRPEEILLEPWEWDMNIDNWNKIILDFWDHPGQSYPKLPVAPKSITPCRGNLDSFISQVADWLKDSYGVFLISPTFHQAEGVKKLLEEYDLGASICLPKTGQRGSQELSRPSLSIFLGELSSSFNLPELGLVFLTQRDFLPVKKSKSAASKSVRRRFRTELRDLKSGDYVVHVNYGIGCYHGLTKLNLPQSSSWRSSLMEEERAARESSFLFGTTENGTFSGVDQPSKADYLSNSEFLLIEYADQEKLYLPVYNIGLVQKYVGSGAVSPKLDKLGGSGWKKTKKKVKESLLAMAAELIKIYAAREITPGIAFSPDNQWMHEFEEQFLFEETPDQLTSIIEVKADMEKARPMDRLICGDVGYGKTEVAMRAAFKAVLHGKQVAILVPTTLLAHQHLQTFTERFTSYPVAIEMLSRFKSKRQQNDIIKRLKEGKVDIIIGTHRLVQKDVQFKDLGLLIVDEEQHFGVKHKERLRAIEANIDVLTLTATPIPRTLHMSLLGVRDLSIIETPPRNRLAIKTYLLKFSPEIIQEAIQQEIDRSGQVFFVHNRIDNIEAIQRFLKRLVPRARTGVAHGQMGERELEEVMVRFVNKELDVLLCTTIIESGLDIPSANTIIINRADKFGLAQLYQLRGRVGRDRYRAHAYLMVPAEELLSQEARMRLMAIRELSDLGSGYLLATRDMEIRGAGNIVGREQSGHIAAVGYELYCQLMEEAIKELQGEKESEKIETTINLGFAGFIPSTYIAPVNQRLESYQKLSLLTDMSELEKFKRELKDRFGPLPPETERLLKIVELKIMARLLQLEKIEKGAGGISFTFHSDTRLSPEAILKSGELPGFRFLAENSLCFFRKGEGVDYIYNETKKILQKLLKLSNL